MGSQLIPVHVEVSLHPSCVLDFSAVEQEVRRLFQGGLGSANITDGPVDVSRNALLSKYVTGCRVAGLADSGLAKVPFWQCDPCVHVFQLSSSGAEKEVLDGEGDADDVAAFDQWTLPSEELEGLWESLLLEENIKAQLMEYATSALLFSDRSVSRHIISWNRVVLLHGPPGTGKTSLCKALAHKLSIRMGKRYQSAQLLEINAHSLFSKWFSESGKLVGRLFGHISELAEDESCLVCILVDEVESLTTARSAAMNGNEPSDSVRVVNAVLTQIDALRARDNVLVLTTSNVSKAIDLAFVDRADIKVRIGLPGVVGRYTILHSCLEELMRTGIIEPPHHIPECSPADAAAAEAAVRQNRACNGNGDANEHDQQRCAHCGKATTTTSQPMQCWGTSTTAAPTATVVDVPMPPCNSTQQGVGSQLMQVAVLAEGLSGRALRKLPFQAHAFFVRRPTTTLEAFVEALFNAVGMELQRRAQLERGDDPV